MSPLKLSHLDFNWLKIKYHWTSYPSKKKEMKCNLLEEGCPRVRGAAREFFPTSSTKRPPGSSFFRDKFAEQLDVSVLGTISSRDTIRLHFLLTLFIDRRWTFYIEPITRLTLCGQDSARASRCMKRLGACGEETIYNREFFYEYGKFN